MTEHKHRRDDEAETFEHERRNDMPSWLRWGLESIKQVGFPAVMCLLVWWKSETTQRQQLAATQDLKYTMIQQSTVLENVLALMATDKSENKERWDHFLAEFRGSRR